MTQTRLSEGFILENSENGTLAHTKLIALMHILYIMFAELSKNKNKIMFAEAPN